MDTLEKLKRENALLRNKLAAKKELISIQQERNKILKQNKALAKILKHPKRYAFIESVGKSSVKTGKKLGRGFYKFAETLYEADQRKKKRRSPIKKKSRIKKTTRKAKKKKGR